MRVRGRHALLLPDDHDAQLHDPIFFRKTVMAGTTSVRTGMREELIAAYDNLLPRPSRWHMTFEHGEQGTGHFLATGIRCVEKAIDM